MDKKRRIWSKFNTFRGHGSTHVVGIPDAQIEDFYSDSYSDDPLARIAKRAILVKGDQLLPWNK